MFLPESLSDSRRSSAFHPEALLQDPSALRNTTPYSITRLTFLFSNPTARNRNETPGVNELLATLRRQGSSSPRSNHHVAAPSVPPVIREILQLPETPAPLPRTRGRVRYDARGRRLPPGPPPPRSWQAGAISGCSEADGRRRGFEAKAYDRATVTLPGEYVPGRLSLVDAALKCVAREWRELGPLEELNLWALPDRTRQAMIRYIEAYHGRDVNLGDLKAILVPDEETDDEGSGVVATNAYFTHLHVPASLSTASTFPSLISLLFPRVSSKEIPSLKSEPQDSWEMDFSTLSLSPGRLLPSLTHLSLAVDPAICMGDAIPRHTLPSWRHLLQLAKKLPGLTHLSLAFWPEPMRTPNAKYASVVGPQGNSIQYGGTGPYSHSLDQDWVEAVNILRTLSKSLYQLQYLDITGCGAWFAALMRSEQTLLESDEEKGGEGRKGCRGVDWAGDWGKIEVLRMKSGIKITEETTATERAMYRSGAELAAALERHIRSQRAGRGRIITVEKDDVYDLRGSSGQG